MDQKGRIHISKKIRKLLKLRPRQRFVISVQDQTIALAKENEHDVENDLVLKDMVENPLYFNGKVTRKLLDKLEEELWSS